MANKVADGELFAFGVCVRNPDLCRGTCKRGEVGVTEIYKALTEENGTRVFSLLCSRRVRRDIFQAALSLAAVRSRSRYGSGDSKSLEQRLRESGRTKCFSLSLHNEIYNQAHDAARFVLGWEISRICAYEQKALARAEGIAKRYGQRSGQGYLALYWPFTRKCGESADDYIARINSLKWKDSQDGPEFQYIAPRTFGSSFAEQFAESVKQTSKELD